MMRLGSYTLKLNDHIVQDDFNRYKIHSSIFQKERILKSTLYLKIQLLNQMTIFNDFNGFINIPIIQNNIDSIILKFDFSQHDVYIDYSNSNNSHLQTMIGANCGFKNINMVDKIDDEITNVVIPTYYLLSMYFVDIMELIKTELGRLIKTESIINQSYDKMIDYEESESEKDNQ